MRKYSVVTCWLFNPNWWHLFLHQRTNNAYWMSHDNAEIYALNTVWKSRIYTNLFENQLKLASNSFPDAFFRNDNPNKQNHQTIREKEILKISRYVQISARNEPFRTFVHWYNKLKIIFINKNQAISGNFTIALKW